MGTFLHLIRDCPLISPIGDGSALANRTTNHFYQLDVAFALADFLFAQDLNCKSASI